ncbi:hypothetical protein F0562_032029 [Nyssa sinensis]|uniref:Serine-threonine/tyrosine-protein kinase catalytic domain-containing protein n=1 Tax=Nyssa sinensis TaxID=561372 RepID=A0A5J5AXM3_9ASTE|nr:hypothetical protein F0562_032029 [Nyssa sinensis]
MSLNKGTFETLVPSRFITFTFPNPSYPSNPTAHRHYLHTPLLRVAVLDSPIQPTTTPTNLPLVAAMLVPEHRETDWTFSTETGHLQLLVSSPEISRLILIGNLPTDPLPEIYDRPIRSDPMFFVKLEESLTPLLVALLPKLATKNGLPEIPFLSYEDDVIRSVTVERCVGSCAGEMLVEDVELDGVGRSDGNREFRRRLRFKRMPNLIQTQVRIVPNTSANVNAGSNCVGFGKVDFRPDTGVLVHPYLTPMVASLSLIGSYLDERIRCGFRPKALCLGVGGGALLTFLNTELGFQIVGVEADEVVLQVARRYFGLEDGEFIQVCVGDGIELIEKVSSEARKQNSSSLGACGVENCLHLDNFHELDTKFDVIMVDLDSSDARMGLSAPPVEFVRKSVLLTARLVLCELGILVINVIPPTRSVSLAFLFESEHISFIPLAAETPEWLAPEVLPDEPSNEKSDVYGFGVILWELRTLQQPWRNLNLQLGSGSCWFKGKRLEIPSEVNLLVGKLIEACWDWVVLQ